MLTNIMNQNEVKAKLCDWCEEFYANDDNLCSGCQLAKEKGYEKYQKRKFGIFFIK